MVSLRKLEQLYGKEFVESLLDLQREIYWRGLPGVDYSEAAGERAATRLSSNVAEEVSKELNTL